MLKLTVWQKLSFGIGALGKDLVYLIVASFIFVYFTDVYKLDPVIVGIIFLVARLFDAINDPVMGLIVDNSTSRFGRFKPYLVLGTVVNSIVLILLYFKPELSQQGLIAYAAIMYILWGLTYTIMDIPYWSMIPDLGSTPKERDQVASIPRFFAGLANLLMGGLGLWAINYLSEHGNSKNDYTGYFNLAVIAALIFLVTVGITVMFVPIAHDTNAKVKREHISLKMMFNLLVKNELVVTILVVSVLFNLMIQFNNNLSIYLFRDVVGSEYFYSRYLFICALGQMTGIFFYPIVARYISRGKIVVCGGILLFVSSMSVLILQGDMGVVSVYIIGLLFGLNLGLLFPILTVSLADGVDYGERKFGIRTESIIFSTQTFVVKLASALSGFLIGIGLKIAEYSPDAPLSSEGAQILIVMMALLPMLLAALYIFIYLKFIACGVSLNVE